MRFILSKPIKEKRPIFADVEANQFFVNANGWLCQKLSSISFLQITDSDGKPCAMIYNGYDKNNYIERILPHVE